MPLPALRYLDVFQVEHEGEHYIGLNDPTGMVEEQVVLTPLAYYIAAHLDGLNGVAEIQAVLSKQFDGVTAREGDILAIVQNLDARGFLKSDAFDIIRQRRLDDFRSAPARPAHFAGKSYPGDGDELRAFLDQQFIRDGAPGECPEPRDGELPHLPGLIVPHIDLHRGGHSYAHGYAELARAGRPDTVIVFGVAHMAEPVPFILTRKDFDTPLGPVSCDHEILDRLASACAWDPYEFELTHRTEHSVEFQVVMLRYLYGADVKIVAVLCSMFVGEDGPKDPGEEQSIRAFLDACRECVTGLGKRVTVLAAADLAHVGKRFGDPFDITPKIIGAVARRDQDDLTFVHEIDAPAFYASVMKDKNARKVCGVNCIYAALKTLEGVASKGRPLHYGYAPDPAGGIVSFAAIALE